MGRNTPTLIGNQLEYYLTEHLGKELHWLLRAATEWDIQNKLKLNIPGYHMQVFAMDSTFLHARTLFEFFTKKTGDNYYGYDEFSVDMTAGARQVPTPYLTEKWVVALHAYLMHAQDRTVPRHLKSFNGTTTKDFKKMPVEFAKGVVQLWREFAVLLGASTDPGIQKLGQIATDILGDAIKSTNDVYIRKNVKEMVRKYRIAPIPW